MKKIKYIASALACVALTGCYDMNTEPMGSTITADQKEAAVSANPERIEASVNGMSAMFYGFGKNVGEGNHNDLSYPAVMLFTDTRGVDLVSEDIGYNWFGAAVTYADLSYTGTATYITWSTFYKQINAVNAVTSMIAPDTEDENLQFYLAQAYAIRAFDYFYLAQLYQQTYVGNENKPCVPLITEANMDAAGSEGCPRSTVAEVYEQIMTDLDNAIALFEKSPVTRADKRYINTEVAYGLRARVNLVMNNWPEAAADAAKALELTDATPYTAEQVSKPTMSEIEDNSWMWGILVAETDRPVTSGICNWPSHMGSLNYGYASVGAWRKISKSLYAAIPATDVRKGWFLDENGVSPNLNAEQAAYAAEAGCPPYTQMKFGTYKDEVYTSTNANDIPMMRVEEMYLILAEAQAMAGDAAAGAATLQSFVSAYRDPAYVCTATTAEQVQNQVWMQRRIELWGEGFSYFDLMRLNKGVDRRGAGFQEAYIFNIPAGDGALIYRLPKDEIEGNPALTEDDNNPVVSRPEPVSE
ncbi:MAG: RagB/SusD family nutrient uptake outer membrane protein [Bacteroidaceae bacterium]|nr:RagB/SusD family nutrient uptake outer membrane protein [Bacteroidaceae bacterium]